LGAPRMARLHSSLFIVQQFWRDPAILMDSDGSVWLTYGSYWSGIHQRQIDPGSGMLLASNPTRYDLATRPGVPSNPIEGASLIHHGKY
jgi:arabinan endo-1,5-alpha-L-arabinosidase